MPVEAQALAVRGGPEVRVTLLELEQCTSHRHCGTIVTVECGGNDIVFFSCFACPKKTRTIGVGIYIYIYIYIYPVYLSVCYL